MARGSGCSMLAVPIIHHGQWRGKRGKRPAGQISGLHVLLCHEKDGEQSLPKATIWQEDIGNEVGGYRITQVESWLGGILISYPLDGCLKCHCLGLRVYIYMCVCVCV